MRITVASAQLFLGKQCHYRTSVKNRVNVVCTLVGDKYGTFLFVQKKSVHYALLVLAWKVETA